MSNNANGKVENISNLALLESMLFVASGPASVSRFAKVLNISSRATQKLLSDLEKSYEGRGFQLQWHNNQVQLTTHPQTSQAVEDFLGLEVTTKLSPAALEVLAIVAYLQPITRPQVDNIRGVNSDGALRSLLSKGLIEEVGRLETPGRPILYGSTPEFLQHFGLSMLEELPPINDEEE